MLVTSAAATFTRPIKPHSYCFHQSSQVNEPTPTRLDFSRKPIKIFMKRLDFGGNFLFKRLFSLVSRTQNQDTMADLDGVFAKASETGVKAFEQEAFIEGNSSSGRAGIETTLNNMSKWVVAATFAAIVLWRHDAEALWAVLGAVLNVILSTVLKRILNHERPNSAIRSDPGMPSSHAQSIFYAVVYIIWSIMEYYGINGVTTTFSGLIVILGSYFSWLRISQGYHTANQVIVGAILGSLFCTLWYLSWNAFVLNAFTSFLWIRILVVLGAIGFCIGFLLHVYKTWMTDEQ